MKLPPEKSMTATCLPKTGSVDCVGGTSGAMTDDYFLGGVEMIESDPGGGHLPLPRRLSPAGAIVVLQSVNDGCLSIAAASVNEREIERS